eukprot:2501687-Amphidinium_carterae.3
MSERSQCFTAFIANFQSRERCNRFRKNESRLVSASVRGQWGPAAERTSLKGADSTVVRFEKGGRNIARRHVPSRGLVVFKMASRSLYDVLDKDIRSTWFTTSIEMLFTTLSGLCGTGKNSHTVVHVLSATRFQESCSQNPG